MNTISLPPLYVLVVGYVVSIACGILVELFMNFLQSRSEVLKAERSDLKRDKYLVRWLGGLERVFYTTCIIIGQPAGVAAWLAIKVLTRWTNDKERWQTISRSNLYLIGNLLNIFFSGLGALIILLWPK